MNLLFLFFLNRLSESTNNPHICQRKIDLSIRNDEQETKTSSRYIPLLPKDLCHIPLRPLDDDLLENMNKRSRSKGRFPFQLPLFLTKHRFFSSKKPSPSTRNSPNGKYLDKKMISSISYLFL
jgi:hypothetical protein